MTVQNIYAKFLLNLIQAGGLQTFPQTQMECEVAVERKTNAQLTNQEELDGIIGILGVLSTYSPIINHVRMVLSDEKVKTRKVRDIQDDYI